MQHHAYYIEGPLSLYETYKQHLKPFWTRTFERFGIDEARELSTLAGLKNFDESIFLLGISSITTEAQQALLKLFEEPQEGTTFVLLVPHGALLPTLRSRMVPYPTQIGHPMSDLEARTFLAASHKTRSAQIAVLLDDDEGVKERVREFVNALEIELAKEIDDPKVRESLQDIARVRDYLRDRSPSLKMLLEHLALCLPKK